jgi:hypothetical protein
LKKRRVRRSKPRQRASTAALPPTPEERSKHASKDDAQREEDDDEGDSQLVDVVACEPRVARNPRAEDMFVGCFDEGLDGPRALAWRAGIVRKPPIAWQDQLAWGASMEEEEEQQENGGGRGEILDGAGGTGEWRL